MVRAPGRPGDELASRLAHGAAQVVCEPAKNPGPRYRRDDPAIRPDRKRTDPALRKTNEANMRQAWNKAACVVPAGRGFGFAVCETGRASHVG